MTQGEGGGVRVADADWQTAALTQIRRVEARQLPRNIGALLDAAAAETPNAVALHFIATGASLTYAELRHRVDRIAAALQALGLRHGTTVAVMLPNVPEMPVTWLALARLGAVMVPVNVRYTGHELRYLLADSGARHLVLHADYRAVLDSMPDPRPALDAVVVCGPARDGEVSWQALLACDAPPAVIARDPVLDDLMNIQYTSGTTGLPKGCLLTQRYWLTCALAYAQCDGLTLRRILSPNPFFYMTPQWLMLMAFYARGTLFVAPHLSLTNFVDWLRDYRIEFCFFPMDIVARTPPDPRERDNTLIRGNLSIHRKELHAELEQRFGFPARSSFGMTEIGLGLFTPIGAAEMVGSGSCGMAAPFREARIADMHGNTLPAGTAGELLFRGPGLLLGYHNQPEATRAAFHGDWFRSGDLATMDARGFVTIVGRIKEMVRRANENISATEVEAALLSLPGIAEAAVVPVPDATRGEEVKAFIVLEAGVTRESLPPARIVAHCAERLASFKVPRFLLYRDTPLPRSTSGKPQKPVLIAEAADPHAGCWDRASGLWL
jgi:crotonobetaine/carnitine-CoA ligase